MKLRELVTPIFESLNVQPAGYYDDCSIKGEALELLKEKIKECDEFKQVEEIIIVDNATIEIEGRNISTQCFMCKGDGFLKGKTFYLYRIDRSPEVYDSATLYKPVKNNASLTPIVADEFKLYQTISIRINPEEIQDDNLLKTGLRDNLHVLLNDILDNPSEY